jgi:hypothetical protein
MYLGSVVPYIFNHSNKNTQLDAKINRKILLLCRTDTSQHVSGIIMPIIRSPSNCRCSLWLVTNKPTTAENTSTSTFIRKPEAERQVDGLLMMCILMPETCWAVSVRQSNKIYDWLLGVLFEWLKMHGTTDIKFTIIILSVKNYEICMKLSEILSTWYICLTVGYLTLRLLMSYIYEGCFFFNLRSCF